MNQITIAGRLTKDAELRYSQSGKAISSFSVACNSGYGDKKTVQYFNCALFGDRAEKTSQYLKKGSPLTVFGEFNCREYDKKDGSKGYSLDVNVSNFELQGRSNNSSNNVPPAPTRNNYADAKGARQPATDDFGDIPF